MALVALFLIAIAMVGIGVFLLGTRQTPEMVSGGAGISGDTSPPAVVPPTAAAGATTVLPTTTVDATVTSTSAVVTAPTTSVPPELADNDAAARADLELHFRNHDNLDLDAAYTGLTASFAPPFDEFVQFWSVDVASVSSPIDECDVTGDRGVCAVRFFITYSGEADEGVRNRCLGQSVELTMQRIDGRFLIDEQRNLSPLDCPAP